MLLALLVAGWTVLPGAHWVWTALALSRDGVAAPAADGRRCWSDRAGRSRSRSSGAISGRTPQSPLAQVALSVTFLAYHAWDTAHAIGLTLVRLTITQPPAARVGNGRRRRGASGRHRRAARRCCRFIADMMASPIIAGVVALIVSITHRDALPSALPFLLLWMIAPGVAYWLSLPVGPRAAAARRSASGGCCARTARKTWRYYETFVTDADSVAAARQLSGGRRAAPRAAHVADQHRHDAAVDARRTRSRLSDDRRTLIGRLDRTLTTLEGLERHEGHFLNWYDTATLAPLHPRYVSTVDSGNLAASLVALAQGLLALAEQPQSRAQLLEGLIDTADLLARGLVVEPRARSAQPRPHRARQPPCAGNHRRNRARELSGDGTDSLPGLGQRAREAAVASRGCVGRPPSVSTRSVSGATPSSDGRRGPGRADRRPRAASRRRWRDARRHSPPPCGSTSCTTGGGGSSRSATVSQTRTGPGRLDASFYDLLASEARLASFRRDRQGRRPPAPLVPPRPDGDQRRRHARRSSRGAGRCSST